jgi:hypothetical protein
MKGTSGQGKEVEQVEENKNIGEKAGGRRTERKIERIYQDGKKRLEDKEGYGKKKEENGRRRE